MVIGITGYRIFTGELNKGVTGFSLIKGTAGTDISQKNGIEASLNALRVRSCDFTGTLNKAVIEVYLGNKIAHQSFTT